MSIITGSISLNSHYQKLLNEYMNEVKLKTMLGKKYSQRQMCQLIIMDFLDEVSSNKELLQAELDKELLEDSLKLLNSQSSINTEK